MPKDSYKLTSLDPVVLCFGSNFDSIAAARDTGYNYRLLGHCSKFIVTRNSDKEIVYETEDEGTDRHYPLIFDMNEND